MTLEEFQRRANADETVVIQRQASIPGPQLLARMKTAPYPTIAEVAAHPDRTYEPRTYRYGHILGMGLKINELNDWRRRWPNHPLPPDLTELLLSVNGIHLWANLNDNRSYIGIAPLCDWMDGATSWWAGFIQPSPIGALIISYHQDGNGAVVFDTKAGTYRWFEWEDCYHPRMIDRSVEELLEWLWAEVRFDPRD